MKLVVWEWTLTFFGNTVLDDDSLNISHNLYFLTEIYLSEFLYINMAVFIQHLIADYTGTNRELDRLKSATSIIPRDFN